MCKCLTCTIGKTPLQIGERLVVDPSDRFEVDLNGGIFKRNSICVIRKIDSNGSIYVQWLDGVNEPIAKKTSWIITRENFIHLRRPETCDGAAMMLREYQKYKYPVEGINPYKTMVEGDDGASLPGSYKYRYLELEAKRKDYMRLKMKYYGVLDSAYDEYSRKLARVESEMSVLKDVINKKHSIHITEFAYFSPPTPMAAPVCSDPIALARESAMSANDRLLFQANLKDSAGYWNDYARRIFLDRMLDDEEDTMVDLAKDMLKTQSENCKMRKEVSGDCTY